MEPLTENMNFDEEFFKMVDLMDSPDNYDRKKMIEQLIRLARMFRLTKVVSEFYRSPTHEQQGDGEVYCDYDIGHDDVRVYDRRYQLSNGVVLKATAYMAEGTEPLNEDEEKKLDVCIRSMLSLLSRKRMQGVIEALAYHDRDGYPNFSNFFRHLEMMNQSCGFKGYTALMYNLRQFSLINRDLGQEAGDMIMRRHFEAVREIIGDNGHLVRVGGDNFAAIFKNEILDKVIKALEGLHIVYDEENDRRVVLSACAGVYIIPPEFKYVNYGSIVQVIYPTCQTAKLEKEGTIVYASKKSVEQKENISRVRRHFEEALEKEYFHAYYQPKVDVQSGKLVGAEALCRWIYEGQIVPPMEFIPVLENNMDICRLDFYMLDRVCKDIRRWLDQGLEVVRVSVNLSRKHLIDVDLLEHIMKIIDRNKVPYKYIEIELTETTTEVELKKLRRLVEGLQEVGISTAVDDFGVGYSSLNLIRELPWNVLKIDKSLLPGVGNDNRKTSYVMFRHIASMAKDLGLECITEGVETAEQVEVLKNNNCLYAQGFYFDKPLPVVDFEERLAKGGYY